MDDQATIEWQAKAWRELCEYLDVGPMNNRRDKHRLFQAIDYYLPVHERRKSWERDRAVPGARGPDEAISGPI